jgi:hypothetical protein
LQAQGKFHQPIFSCKFSRDRGGRSRWVSKPLHRIVFNIQTNSSFGFPKNHSYIQSSNLLEAGTWKWNFSDCLCKENLSSVPWKFRRWY